MLRHTAQPEYSCLILNLLQRFIPTGFFGCLELPLKHMLSLITFIFKKIMFNSNNPSCY